MSYSYDSTNKLIEIEIKNLLDSKTLWYGRYGLNTNTIQYYAYNIFNNINEVYSMNLLLNEIVINEFKYDINNQLISIATKVSKI